MKKISKSAELLWVLGTIFISIGVAICSKTNLGVSMIVAPNFVLHEAFSPIWSGFTPGVAEYAVQGVLLIILCITLKKFNWRYLLAFVVAVISGYALDLVMWIMEPIAFNTLLMRWIMLIVGDVITGLGVACFFRTYLPKKVYELFVSEIKNRFSFQLHRVKWIFDLSLLGVSIILAVTVFGDVREFDWSSIGYSSFHNIGLGTLITTFINSPIIAMMVKLLDKIFDSSARFPKLEKFIKTKS